MKNMIIGIVILFLVAIVSITIPAMANDHYSKNFKKLNEKLDAIKTTQEVVLVEIGDEKITNKDFETFKAYMQANKELTKSDVNLTEQYLWQQLISDLLLYEKAKELNLDVRIEEAQAHSLEMRKVLENSQNENAKAFQKRIIEATGLDVETYWKEYAPKQYQELLSINNLVQHLIQEGTIAQSDNPEQFNKELKEYVQSLYNEYQSKIKILDNSIKLNLKQN